MDLKKVIHNVKMLPKKTKIIFSLFAIVVVLFGVALPILTNQNNKKTVVDNNIEKESIVENEVYKKDGNFNLRFKGEDFKIKHGDNGYTNILLGGLKTGPNHVNSILVLLSFDFKTGKTVLNTFDPRVSFDGVDPQVSYGTDLITGVSKELGIDIQYYGELTRDGLNALIVSNDGVKIGEIIASDLTTGFNLLTESKGSKQYMNNVSKFLERVIGGTFFSINVEQVFGEPGVNTSIKDNGIKFIEKIVQLDGFEFDFQFNNFELDRKLGFYSVKKVDGKNVGIVTDKTKEIIKESLSIVKEPQNDSKNDIETEEITKKDEVLEVK